MAEDTREIGKVIQIDEGKVREHLFEMVRGSVEETLNAMLETEADQLCQAKRYERNEDRGSIAIIHLKALGSSPPRRCAFSRHWRPRR